MDSLLEKSDDGCEDNTPTRQSSKLSLGSSPSVLSAEDGERMLHFAQGIEEEDDDELFAYHADSPEPLSNEATDIEHENDDDDGQYSASPLSSVPDDFPLSRSASPELGEDDLAMRKRKIDNPDEEDEDEDEDEDNPTAKKPRSLLDLEFIAMEEDKNPEIQSVHPLHVNETEKAHPNSKTTPAKRLDIKEVDTRSRRRSIRGEPLEKQREEESPEEEDEEVPETPEEKGKRLSLDTEPRPIKTTRSKAQSPTEDKFHFMSPTFCEEEDEEEDLDSQRRHNDALKALTFIEVEFARLRDKMYEEKMNELNEEATMIANGTHPELVALMEEIEAKKGKRIREAEAWRTCQHNNFRQQFEGVSYQANMHFASKKNALRREILASLNGKRFSMENERAKLNDITPDRPLSDPTVLLLRKRHQKEESGELQDIKETIGFPMAPPATGLSNKDIEEDLLALRVS
ncbi:Sds3-like-domain-containing protein [Phycomyces nitens]|nr:Sds3-like-domain-containing protein [Phycomyces nitens]